jgi:Lytic transglycolase
MQIIPARTSELYDALAWSVNIEEYYHRSPRVSRLLRCRAGAKLDGQGFFLPRTRRQSLPFGTHVRVTNLSNNRATVLVVSDRGPFFKGRIIDVSTGAADVLGFSPGRLGAGHGRNGRGLASGQARRAVNIQ